MKEKEVFITIQGKACSGKSRLLYMLKKFLKEQNFEVEFDGTLDFPTENDFDNFMHKDIEIATQILKKNRKIFFKEITIK